MLFRSQVALRNEIARLLHAETGRAPLVLMERRDARWLADHDVKAVVEVHVPVVSLLKMGELPIGNPALVFQMPVRFRVLDRSGEAEILRWQVEQRSSNMFRFFKWADEDAKRFREQLQRAVTSTAAAIVRRLH